MIILRDLLRYVNVKRMSNVLKKTGGRNVSTRYDSIYLFFIYATISVNSSCPLMCSNVFIPFMTGISISNKIYQLCIIE